MIKEYCSRREGGFKGKGVGLSFIVKGSGYGMGETVMIIWEEIIWVEKEIYLIFLIVVIV